MRLPSFSMTPACSSDNTMAARSVPASSEMSYEIGSNLVLPIWNMDFLSERHSSRYLSRTWAHVIASLFDPS